MVKSYISSAIRHGLTTLSGAIGIEGLATDDNVQLLTSAALIFVSIAWSFLEKKLQIKPVDYKKLND